MSRPQHAARAARDQTIRERSRAGFSLREVAAWLTARGTPTSYETVRSVLAKGAPPARGAAAPSTRSSTSTPRPATTTSTTAAHPADLDLEALDVAIRELEADTAKAREAGNLREANAMRRIWLDACERRRRVRPPPPPADDHADAREAGAKCLAKLRRGVDLAREELVALPWAPADDDVARAAAEEAAFRTERLLADAARLRGVLSRPAPAPPSAPATPIAAQAPPSAPTRPRAPRAEPPAPSATEAAPRRPSWLTGGG